LVDNLPDGAALHILEQRKGGQVIDLRPGVPKAVLPHCGLVYGTVVIVTADGKVTVEIKEPEGHVRQGDLMRCSTCADRASWWRRTRRVVVAAEMAVVSR
jgi:hypothetical protein